ncbi:MAG: helix-turn-helix transcriptional regulator [Lawsonibacter sp.]|jgi:transcriptional regulator with XRE-family HTH domain|nr:helix-turn-helix transcriptional regulator [Lawsonibacter sp.]MCI9655486.1 helix-turn-helix transcriptional regulator [Lawsonibacter sp.]
MTAEAKIQIGRRLRRKREQAGYTREKLGELCSLSPRFIANIELGDSTFSLDSLMTVCRILSCSSDYLLFDKEEGETPLGRGL